MEKKVESGPPNGDESDSQKGPSLGFFSFPKVLRSIVADYISDDNKHPMKRVLLDGRRITLCLSQDLNLELGSYWRFGCLSSDDLWESSLKANVDNKFLFENSQSCVDLLKHENSLYWSFGIEVLVVQLELSSDGLSVPFFNLLCTLVQLKEHLNSVQHVVFAIDKYAFCCFSFNDVIDSATGLRHTVDRLLALTQILRDFHTCWANNHTLNTGLLLDYYVLKDAKPKSEAYLSKFVILLNHFHNVDLFNIVDPTLKSSKLRWLYYWEIEDDFKPFDERIAGRCHAYQMDTFKFRFGRFPLMYLMRVFSLKHNPFVERIVIDSGDYDFPIQLPRPSAPLTDNTPRSALIELTLKGVRKAFNLTQLDSGYFSNLAHLSIIGGEISGRLDSQSVPSLKTLRIELGIELEQPICNVDPLVHKHTQSLIDADRPWQLVASIQSGGWSLASYDEPNTSPLEDRKEDAPPSPPIIRELMLVMRTQQHADECQSRLNGHPSPEAAADDQNDNLLVWDPECVEKITAFSIKGMKSSLEFKDEIPGKTRALKSLACHGIKVELHGAALPQLKSLVLGDCSVTLTGTFPHLQTLSLEDCDLKSPWEVCAPLLESLDCQRLRNGDKLSLRPELLLRLSYLKIEPYEYGDMYFPTILVEKDGPGLSHVKHVVFGREMTVSHFFDQCQVQNVSHLELIIDALKPPACWKKTEWLCETLKMDVYLFERENEDSPDAPVTVVLPELPRVQKLTVTEENCKVMLDSEMPELTYCTVPSPGSLGSNLKCPKLRCIYFTKKLPESDKEKCLDRATYEAIGAQPKWVYFADGEELNRMSWDAAPSAVNASSTAMP